jgi:Kef-type K+ transport system membrane component KefB
MIEAQFLAFFIALLVAVLFSSLFSRFNIPWAVTLILGGIIAGPSMFNWIQLNDTILFLAEIGAVFLMFMAGLETPMKSLRHSAKSVGSMAIFNGAVPFVVGFLIGMVFNLGPQVSALLGIIFISSSVAAVVPTLDRNKLLDKPIGHIIIGSTIIQDVVSLVLISMFLQLTDPVTWMPLPVFYILLAAFIIFLYKFVNWIRRWVIIKGSFHQEFQFIILILTGIVVLFSVLGLHHIIAGFFTGFVLSESLDHNKIKNRLHTVGYGIFIPIFFVLVGTSIDFKSISSESLFLPLATVIVIGLISSKFISGYVAARWSKFNKVDSSLIAVTSVPQLATTLAVAYTALTAGIIDQNIASALIVLSVVTTIISPIATQKILKLRKSKSQGATAVSVESQVENGDES